VGAQGHRHVPTGPLLYEGGRARTVEGKHDHAHWQDEKVQTRLCRPLGDEQTSPQSHRNTAHTRGAGTT
jgi:hypothetical protein